MKTHRLHILFLLNILAILTLILVNKGCGGGGGGGSYDGGGGNGGTSATLISIAVTPTNPSIAKGTTQQFTATGTYSDNTKQDMSTQVTWNSSDTGIATINLTGLATSIAAGTTTITATYGGISGNTTLTVTPATLVSIAVTPANPSIAKGTTQQFTATGTFSDSTTQNLTTQVTWSSSNPLVATISNAGLATSVDVGTTAITATVGTVSRNTTLTVTPATLSSITVTPTNPSIAKGTTQQFSATGTFSDGTTQNLTYQVTFTPIGITWGSSNAEVATISSTGLATSIGAGTTTITATFGTVSGNTTLTVTEVTLTSIAVTPTNPIISKGATEQFTAIGTYSDSTTQDLTTQVTWGSSDISVATISNAAGSNGLVTTITAGSTTITATTGSISGSTTLTVTPSTIVCGIISSDTTWTLAGNPYVVNCNVLVNSGVTLTIEPGVIVMFDTDNSLQIAGTLIARGTSANMITFTSDKFIPAPGDWGNIVFSDSSIDATYDGSGNYTGGSILEYITVEYAGGGGTGCAVAANSASPFINHATIRNNAAIGICASGLLGKYLKIYNSIISNNISTGGGGGIYVEGSIISNNNIITSNNSGWRGGGIYTLYGGTISNSIICNNNSNGYEGGGIFAYSYPTISNNIICNNNGSEGGGISAEGATVTNNTIINNTAPNAPAYGFCCRVAVLRYNTITGNTATGSAPTYAVEVYGYYGTSTLNYNNIFGNDSIYEIGNYSPAGSAAVDATNNWWGTATESEIQAKIYDFFDDSSRGVINYNPWSTAIRIDAPISPPTGLTPAAGSGQIALSWSANPESDTAGYKVYWGMTSGFPYANSADVGDVTTHTIGSLSAGTYYVTVTAYDTDAASVTDDPNTPVNEKQTSGHESWYAVEKTVSVP